MARATIIRKMTDLIKITTEELQVKYQRESREYQNLSREYLTSHIGHMGSIVAASALAVGWIPFLGNLDPESFTNWYDLVHDNFGEMVMFELGSMATLASVFFGVARYKNGVEIKSKEQNLQDIEDELISRSD